MRTARTMGNLVFGVWLLLWGLVQIIDIPFPLSNIILGALAVVAGMLLLLGL
ncbi:MAG: hypothetical protein IIC78_04600 [Chloroflexi bacterium]|nr:hypothetical protein [Chloroflexota bacterium]